MTEKRDLISVIVPIYNAELYIEKCVLSIVNQTYENIEIILVNDGSTDRSLDICKLLADQFNTIKVIDKPNSGVSATRNRGIEEARGELIGFVDSDDWIEPSMYEELYEYLKTEKCEIVECGVNIADSNGITFYPNKENEVITGNEALKRQLRARNFNCIPRISVWSKLFYTEMWRGMRFPEGQVHEEYMVTCKALYNTKRFGIVNKGLYDHLADNFDSITHAHFSKKNLFLEKQYYDRIMFFKEKGEHELEQLARIKYYRLLFSLYYQCHENNMNEEQDFLELIKKNKRDIFISDLTTPEKIKTILLIASPKAYCFLKALQK